MLYPDFILSMFKVIFDAMQVKLSQFQCRVIIININNVSKHSFFVQRLRKLNIHIFEKPNAVPTFSFLW